MFIHDQRLLGNENNERTGRAVRALVHEDLIFRTAPSGVEVLPGKLKPDELPRTFHYDHGSESVFAEKLVLLISLDILYSFTKVFLC